MDDIHNIYSSTFQNDLNTFQEEEKCSTEIAHILCNNKLPIYRIRELQSNIGNYTSRLAVAKHNYYISKEKERIISFVSKIILIIVFLLGIIIVLQKLLNYDYYSEQHNFSSPPEYATEYSGIYISSNYVDSTLEVCIFPDLVPDPSGYITLQYFYHPNSEPINISYIGDDQYIYSSGKNVVLSFKKIVDESVNTPIYYYDEFSGDYLNGYYYEITVYIDGRYSDTFSQERVLYP